MGLVGAHVRMALELEADIPGGAPDAVVRIVTENHDVPEGRPCFRAIRSWYTCLTAILKPLIREDVLKSARVLYAA